jgi:hypothetical protein
MNRLLPGIAVLCTLLAAAPALGDELVSQTTAANQRLQSGMNQRNLRGCMLKKMIADKGLAYNEAKRACTDQLRARNDAPARPLAAAATQTGS